MHSVYMLKLNTDGTLMKLTVTINVERGKVMLKKAGQVLFLSRPNSAQNGKGLSVICHRSRHIDGRIGATMQCAWREWEAVTRNKREITTKGIWKIGGVGVMGWKKGGGMRDYYTRIE